MITLMISDQTENRAFTEWMAKAEGVTEELKRTDQLKWVGTMNSIKDRAEEIISHELVYTVNFLTFYA